MACFWLYKSATHKRKTFIQGTTVLQEIHQAERGWISLPDSRDERALCVGGAQAHWVGQVAGWRLTAWVLLTLV